MSNRNPLVEAVVSVLNTHLNEAKAKAAKPEPQAEFHTDEAETRHVVKGMRHNSRKDMNHVHELIGKHLHAMHPDYYKSPKEAEKKYDSAHENAEFHHDYVHRDAVGKPGKHETVMHHASMDDYAKHAAKEGHKWIKETDEDEKNSPSDHY